MKLPREVKSAVNKAKKHLARANGVLRWYALEHFELKLAKNKHITSARKKNERHVSVDD